MSWLLPLLMWCSLFAILGALTGGMTGLIPGLHPNTLAILLIGLPQVTGFMMNIPIADELQASISGAMILGSFLIGVLIAHSFMEIVPTAMMGVVGDDTAVALLPAQRLFAMGRADLLIESVIIGGLGATLIFALLIFPLRVVMGDPTEGYSLIKSFMGILLIAICSIVLFSSRKSKKLVRSLFLFVSSGALGIFVLQLKIPNYVTNTLLGDHWSAEPSMFLLAAFAGFFAIPSILHSSRMEGGSRQYQPTSTEELFKASKLRSICRGILPSILVGWIPGITNAYATALALSFRRRRQLHLEGAYRYIITYSATNIGGAVQAVLALATIFRPRNGTLEAIASLTSWTELGWTELASPPITVAIFLWSAGLASVVGSLLFSIIGRRVLLSSRGGFHWSFRAVVLIFLLILILWSSGPIGYLVMLPSIILGSYAIASGAPRIHLMGFLLIPVIIYFIS